MRMARGSGIITGPSDPASGGRHPRGVVKSVLNMGHFFQTSLKHWQKFAFVPEIDIFLDFYPDFETFAKIR